MAVIEKVFKVLGAAVMLLNHPWEQLFAFEKLCKGL